MLEIVYANRYLIPYIVKIYTHPATLTLLNIGVDTYSKPLRTVIAHIQFAARVTLTSYWKSPSSPKLEEVIAQLNVQCQYETLLPPLIA